MIHDPPCHILKGGEGAGPRGVLLLVILTGSEEVREPVGCALHGVRADRDAPPVLYEMIEFFRAHCSTFSISLIA